MDIYKRQQIYEKMLSNYDKKIYTTKKQQQEQTRSKTINPEKIQKTSNFISTSSDQKKINETIEETTSAIEEKSYEFTTIKPKKADLKDKRKQLTTKPEKLR